MPRTALLAVPSAWVIRCLQPEPLEVLAFGKVDRDRVVGRGAQVPMHLHVDARIGRGARDDLLEEIRRHRARAREREQVPAGRQQLHRPEVDVLVGARGVGRRASRSARTSAGRARSGRTLAAWSRNLRRCAKTSAAIHSARAGVEGVRARGCGAPWRAPLPRYRCETTWRRAALQRREREAPGVAEGVEHVGDRAASSPASARLSRWSR